MVDAKGRIMGGEGAAASPNTHASQVFRATLPTAWAQHVLDVWEKHLGTGTVTSETSDFFLLGGHSLTVSKVVSQMRLKPEFRYISAVHLYQNRKFADFSTHASALAEEAVAEGVALQEKERLLSRSIETNNGEAAGGVGGAGGNGGGGLHPQRAERRQEQQKQLSCCRLFCSDITQVSPVIEAKKTMMMR